jgi:carboxypeptidase Taq
MEKKLEELKIRLKEVSDLNGAQAVLGWDQSTYMPGGGAVTRGRQLSTLGVLAQQKFTDPAVGKLLDDLQKYAEGLPPDSDDARLISVARRDYERAVKIPPEFVSRFMIHQAASFETWKNARPANDFGKVRPLLEKTVELSREMAEFFAPYEHVADPLIDNADFGMKASTVRKLFNDLRAKQVPIVKAITSQKGPDVSFMTELFPRDKQMEFSREVVKMLGYDYDRGRDDISHHPFTTSFSQDDVRITTRVNEHDLGDCLFSMIHESGHAMYEQGVNPEYEGTPLAGGQAAPPPACTNRNPACGRTWWVAAAASGNSSTRSCRQPSRT